MKHVRLIKRERERERGREAERRWSSAVRGEEGTGMR
jgi:hypothetical protein